ncbi:MAG: hypothetical protein ACHQJ5_05895, partial [Vicinamibacteria bacterium]
MQSESNLGTTAPAIAGGRLSWARLRLHAGSGPAIAGWVLPFALVLALGLRNGGYGVAIRSEVGVAAWWIVLIGAASGIIAFGRIGRPGWILIAILAAFAAWTGIAIGWSESAERSVVELGRSAAYLGVLVLAIAVQGRTAARHTINGL